MKRRRTREERIAETIEADAAEAFEKIDTRIERVVRYRCTCGEEYLSREEAESCLATERGPSFAVGDVVLAGRFRFGWFDGDERWIAERRIADRKTASGEEFSFYYVVTHVDRDEAPYPQLRHRPRYHLATRAMAGRNGYASGYTFDEHHLTPLKVENPPKLPGLAELVAAGEPAKHLL